MAAIYKMADMNFQCPISRRILGQGIQNMTNKKVPRIVFSIKMAHGVPLYGMLLQLHQRTNNYWRFIFLFLQLCFHVAANVCYYFECYTV